jgi:hypothetical protein
MGLQRTVLLRAQKTESPTMLAPSVEGWEGDTSETEGRDNEKV